MAAGDAETDSDAHPQLAERLRPFTTTIFATMSELAVVTDSVNLGQGFPDTDGPAELKEIAAEAIRHGNNQYPPSAGIAELRRAVAAHQHAWYDLDLNPDTEILVTVGATEAIAATFLALCEPGDEVVMFEPSYDSYAACASMAGAVPRLVRLHPPDWAFDPTELAAAAARPRARLLLLNTPHNPTGKVFSADELGQVAALCRAHDLLAVTDEVYEHLVFDGLHIPLATLPGMRERTLTISSGGKTFSFTGWKVGWVSGPAPLVGAVRAAKQFLTYTSPAPLQLAIAHGLGFPPDQLSSLAAELAAKRDLFCDGLASLGYAVYRPSATYFATTDIAAIAPGLSAHDYCLALPERCGVVAIPSSVFYDPADPDAGRTLVRWAFCKQVAVLRDAVTRLTSWSE
ncbi:MAG TPA: aminotransferase class I/II-fold pyridoxal phosphate-dependent enzyme [Acidimicrobiales bacterium]|nr:aminotransferase class I/II-fold pyridoxal phosphate-dependent enzyme [Acidimicrobiales bacterium]